MSFGDWIRVHFGHRTDQNGFAQVNSEHELTQLAQLGTTASLGAQNFWDWLEGAAQFVGEIPNEAMKLCE